ncbi:MAG: LysR family transcriptional regulator [Sulfitobacter sp.]
MEKFDVLKTDFHGLQVIITAHRLGSLTKAAVHLGLSQSTLSYTLDRMRLVFSDPLFVRQGRGIVPTQRCDELIPELEQLLRSFKALTQPQEFDPATTTAKIVISCNYYERAVLIPTILSRIRAEAPSLRVKIITSDTHGHEQLLTAECDVLLSPLKTELSGLMTRSLFHDRYVCILRQDDPRAADFSMDDYRNGEHLTVNYDQGWRPLYLEKLEKLGVSLDRSIEVPSLGSAPSLMKTGHLIMTVPSRLAQEFGPSCTAVSAPFDVTFELRLFWAARSHETPINRWLRSHIIAATSEVVAKSNP